MTYQLIDGRVTSDDGRVAIEHYNTNPANISISGTTYVFMPSHNVSLAWVLPEHVDTILKVKTKDTGCNCGIRIKFHLASLTNVNLNVTGER